MTNRILVTYASRTGSTIGVAQAIGAVLTEHGAQVDVLSMPDVKDLNSVPGSRSWQRHSGECLAAGSHAVYPDTPGCLEQASIRRIPGLYDDGHG